MEEYYIHQPEDVIVNPQTLRETGSELDISELPVSALHQQFLASYGLEEGMHTSYVSSSFGKQSPERIDWHVLRSILNMKQDEKGAGIEKQHETAEGLKEEIDELEDESPSMPPDDRRLLHTRHLVTNYPLSMRKLKGGRWMNQDFTELAHEVIDEVLAKLQDLKAHDKPFLLEGSYDVIPGRMVKTSAKYPVTSPLGWIKRKSTKQDVFLLHPQLSDEAEMADYMAYGLIMDEKHMRDADRPEFRETWFNSLVLLLETPGCPFDVETSLHVTLHKHTGAGVRVGQKASWTVTFDTRLNIYGTVSALVDRPALPPTLSEHMKRVLHVLIPSPNTASDASKLDITLQGFYDILRPASTPPEEVLQVTQPPAMIAQLKPFQKRAVAWLLSNENARHIHPYFARPQIADPAGLWEEVPFGVPDEAGPQSLAFCRVLGRAQKLSAQLTTVREEGKGKGRESESDVDESDDRTWLSPPNGVFRMGDIRGSLLAEEMGLGKTLEAIATIMLHPRPASQVEEAAMKTEVLADRSTSEGTSETQEHPNKRQKTSEDLVAHVGSSSAAFIGTSFWDEELKLKVHEIKSTLIVTPKILLRQWIEETKKHAPSLTYVVYEGYYDMMADWLDRGSTNEVSATSRKRKREQAAEGPEKMALKPGPDETASHFFQRWYDSWITKMRTTDVVFVTYDTMGKDLDVALAPVERPRRAAAGPPRDKPRSVLSMCQFWRVVMDEVQMLDANSSSKAARMVTGLRRINSLVLSGTPAKQDVHDLRSSLTFVGIDISSNLWDKLLRPGYRTAFEALFGQVAIRHTKKMVKNETGIPPQTRTLIPITMNIVELQYYRDTLYRNIDALAASSTGYRDTDVLRGLVQTLRSICTHIQANDHLRLRNDDNRVGRVRLNGEDGGVLRDMDQALGKMQTQAWRDYHHLIYVLQADRIKYALALHSDDKGKYRRSIDMLTRVEKECARNVVKLQDMISQLKENADTSSEEEDNTEDGDSDTAGEMSHKASTVLRSRVNNLQHLQHEAFFRLGDLYHQHLEEEGYGDMEEQSYNAATAIRQQLLARPLEHSNSSIAKVQTLMDRTRVRAFEDLEVEDCPPLGIVTAKYATMINDFLDAAMNANAEHLWNLRGQVMAGLKEPIDNTDDDANATGEEYEATLQAQSMLEANMSAFTDALADRREILTSVGAHIEQIQRKKGGKRTTQTSRETATAIPEDADDTDHIRDLKATRQAYREAFAGGKSLQGLILLLDDFASQYTGRSEEAHLARIEQQRLRNMKERQMTLLKHLEDEAKGLNQCFNVRLTYFRILQQISDTLVDPDAVAVDREAIVALDDARLAERMKAARLKERTEILENLPDTFITLERQIAAAQAHARYLESLSKSKTDQGEDEDCMICQQELEEIKRTDSIMVLQCAHRLCQTCYTEYLRTTPRAGCPCCRLVIQPSQVRKVTAFKKALPAPAPAQKAEDMAGESDIIADALDLDSINTLPQTKHDRIREVEILGQWGAKLDFLIKHLKFWKRTQPGTKHIVFSAWASSLSIVETALTSNGIKWKTMGTQKTDKNAVKDFAISDDQVFLLHGERQVTGLTLTAATVVHMLEPVLNQGYELQAIGRVDRLGQERETHVFCYACEETIEAKIINRGLSAGHCIYAKGVDHNAFDAEATKVSDKKGADKNSGNHDDLMDLLL